MFKAWESQPKLSFGSGSPGWELDWIPPASRQVLTDGLTHSEEHQVPIS